MGASNGSHQSGECQRTIHCIARVNTQPEKEGASRLDQTRDALKPSSRQPDRMHPNAMLSRAASNLLLTKRSTNEDQTKQQLEACQCWHKEYY